MKVLLNNLLKGSPEAWEEFVDRFSRLIYKVFCTRTFGFSRDDIEELFNDFMVGLIKDNYHKVRLYEGRNDCSFPSYLKKIAINMAIDRKKKLIRNRMTSLNASWDHSDPDEFRLMDTIDSGTADPNALALRREETDRFLDALYRLAPAKLLVVLLIIYHEFDRVELAKLLGTSRQNIDVIYNRCKEQLKKLLQEGGRKGGSKGEDRQWSAAVQSKKEQLGLQDRGETLERCIKALKVPEELLVGVVFMNALSVEPTPKRIMRLLNLDFESVQDCVEKMFNRILSGKDEGG
jgi:RNA polymerase sigma factor (sigma-70 family)